jgi:pimeloyl-ACP methyl ester carboxylesterase
MVLTAALALTVALAATPAHSLAPPSAPESQMLALPSGESLKVTTLGQGRAVVLVPGLFGSAYGFRKLMPALAAAGWRVVVIEPLGVGESGRPAEADYSLTAQADRLAAALKRLGIEHAIVAAHSVGASMAFRLAYRHAAQVEAVVSIEGGVAESAATASFRRAMKLAPLLKLLGPGFVRGKIRSQLAERSADPSWVTDDVVEGYTRGAAADLGATLKAYQRMGDSVEPEALGPHLADLRCPVRLLLGAVPHDGGPKPADVDRLQQSVHTFTIERVPAAGHFIFEEAPNAIVEAVAHAAADAATQRRYAEAAGSR